MGTTLTKGNGLVFETPQFSATLKTGYGCIRLLKKILDDSLQLDSNGKPKKLFFYNMGFGESYLVVVPPSGKSFSQTEDQNMIWSYQVNMTILAPLNQLSEESKQSTKALVATGIIQKGLSTVANGIVNFIPKIVALP